MSVAIRPFGSCSLRRRKAVTCLTIRASVANYPLVVPLGRNWVCCWPQINVLVWAIDVPLKTFKGDHYDGYVIEGLFEEWVLYYIFDSQSSLFMNLVPEKGVFDTIPNSENSVMICKFVKNAISSHNNEVMVRVDLKRPDFWLRNDYIRIPSKLRKFGLWISKSSTNWESSWEYSLRPNHDFWLLWVIIDSNGCSMVDLASISDYSLLFGFFWWFVILTKPTMIILLKPTLRTRFDYQLRMGLLRC